MATKWASRESCKSVSINAAPRATAFRNAARVFSGAFPDAPRCAMTSTKLFPPPESLRNTTALKKFLLFREFCDSYSPNKNMLSPPVGARAGSQLGCILNLTERKMNLTERKGSDKGPGGDYEKGTTGPVYDGAASRAHGDAAIFRRRWGAES